MPFNLRHILVSESLEPVAHEDGGKIWFTVGKQGRFQILYPGKLTRTVVATVRHSTRVDQPSTPLGGHGIPRPLHNGVQVNLESIACDLRIFTPDGDEFTRDAITLQDLQRYRDLRGSPRGEWLYSLSGRSRDYQPVGALHETVTDPRGSIELSVFETVKSESALPLVPDTPLDGSRQSFSFDLYRVGTFVATVAGAPFHGSMHLYDPDGTQMAASTSNTLRCEIPLAALGRSRDTARHPRPWKLDVAPQGGTVTGAPRISATVIGAGRIGTEVFRERIERILGPHGSFIQLVGENTNGEARARLTITDPVAAETIDLHHLLDSALSKEQQDPLVDAKDVNAGVSYTLYSRPENLEYGLTLDVSTLKLRSIDVTVGAGNHLGADIPAVTLKVKTSGKVKVTVGPATLADAQLRDGHFVMEVGLAVDPDGTPRIVTWAPDTPFDIDLNGVVLAALLATLGPAGAGLGQTITEYVEHLVNETFAGGAKALFDDPLIPPTILMTIFGAHLTYLPARIDGSTIVFEHIAPLEPDPKPRANYWGVVGRRYEILGPVGVSLHPRTLNTWAADNLMTKVDHVVAIMMENRSYDHVLGYRARPPYNDGADGLTDATISAIEGTAEQHVVGKLSEAGFLPNALHLMTRIPKGVGHELEDVQQQLAGRTAGAGGQGEINDPKGFVDNFRDKRLQTDPKGCVPDDVLGYYEAKELPIFAHLAENFAYCDRYFCAHPGPTLPNRMYSLAGDLQYDRLGVPILANNHGDNFLLSRAETIYDVLTKQGVSWRVYESAPSVTMLRMFARYATNETDIRPLDRLEADLAAGDLPSFTYIEPAMHHHPEDDDHPDADMYRGQKFIRRVYEALRSSPVWERTLLIITYDEHGGLYDHVVPPVADLLNVPRPDRVDGGRPVADGGGGNAGGGNGGSVGTHGRGGRGEVGVDIRNGPVATAHPDRTPPPPVDRTIVVPYGLRVPTFVVSPWTMRGKGPSIILDHCSILKTVLARFAGGAKPFLNDRVGASQSFEAFLTEPQARRDIPSTPVLGDLPITARALVPGASQIVTPPLSRKRMREGPVDYHDISGRVARMLGR